MDQKLIRNFCIIAHIDHGKSTLADRFLEVTGTVPKREMQDQLLDQMDLERERGITIKLQPVAMRWKGHLLNLIDTPGHVDFTYEVSRSLACVEGAILLVDATQGVQAQTIANLELARAQKLTIIPVINKVDLPAANAAAVAQELEELLGVEAKEILSVSAKSGLGVEQVLEKIIALVPPPQLGKSKITRALIFDSRYDDFRGVVASVRLFDGQLQAGNNYRLLGSKASGEILEVGTYTPKLKSGTNLTSGEIGYVVTGLKDIRLARVGDTLAVGDGAADPLVGYHEVVPMVYAGFFPAAGQNVEKLRDALGKLRLNDASLVFEGDNSPALGYGFRCGFLGLLHLDVTRERLRREYNLEIIVTTPSVAYKVKLTNGESTVAHGALELPNPDRLDEVQEPIVKVDVVTPTEYLGNLMKVAQDFRGLYINTDYLGSGARGEGVAILRYELPLNAILVDFYDKIKSVSQGYASMSYEFLTYRPCEVRRLDILVADEVVEPLASIVYTDEAYRRARVIVGKLKEVLPRQMFEVKIQAALGGNIVAAERLPAMRKDVLARANSGGDVTRKRKLLEKQKAGKKRMRLSGKVAIPPEAYLALVSREEK